MVYSGDVINERVNAICSEFVKSQYANIDKIVAEFDENDEHCWFWWNTPDDLWFDRRRLRQLLIYIKEHSITNFTVNIYKTWDGGRISVFFTMSLHTSKPTPNEDDLEIHVIKPVFRYGFWL